MVERAAGYIVRNGPVTPQDRWEENAGLNGHTLAITVAALVAAGQWLEGDARDYALELADVWNASIEEWTTPPAPSWRAPRASTATTSASSPTPAARSPSSGSRSTTAAA